MLNRRILLGGLFVGGALLCGLLTWCSTIRTANRVEGFTPITRMSLLGDMTPGKQVLVEGQISQRNPIKLQDHGFVAYLREGRAIVDSKGTPSAGNWSVSERVTPPLLIELSGGLAAITNDDYDLENGKTIEAKPSAFEKYSDTRYSGVERGDSVIAVGVVTAHGAQPTIKADFVARGTQANYAASQRNAGVIFFVISVVVAVVGGIFIMREQVWTIYFRIKHAGGSQSRPQSG